MRWFIGAIVYFVLTAITAAALNADWRSDITCRVYADLSQKRMDKDFRQTTALATLPPMWISVLLVTGFYSSGLTFYHGPCRSEELVR